MERLIAIPLDEHGQKGRSVTIRNPQTLSWRQLKELRAKAKENEDGGVEVLRDLIQSWDVEDTEGNVLPSLSERPDAIEDIPIGILLHVTKVAFEHMDSAVPKELRTPSATT